MGIEIGAQIGVLWRAALLGALLSLFYDALRALRLRRRAHSGLTAVLDLLYSLTLLVLLLAFTLRVGNGELRLYTLLAITCGAAAGFALLSPLLRPLWDFWADCLLSLLRLLQLPFALAKKYYGKLYKVAKKLFLFSHRSLIIRDYRRSALRARRRAERKERIRYGKAKGGTKKGVRRRPSQAAAFVAAASRRRSSAPSAREDQQRGE